MKPLNAKINPRAEVNKNHEGIVRHALKKASKMIHHSLSEYNIVPSMREEIAFFQRFLEPDYGVIWQAPIAHLINKIPIATACGDACLYGAGGFSTEL